MARSLLLQRSINHTNQPDPLVVGNLTVDNDATIGDNLTVSGLTDIEVLNATSGVFTAAVSVQSLGVTADVEIGGDITIDGDIESTAGNITLTSGALNVGGDTVLAGTYIGNLVELESGIRIVAPNTATAILQTDRVLFISTTGAGGPFVITPTDLELSIYKITIIMTSFNTSQYTFACLQGTVTFGATGDAASFIFCNGIWSLMGEPHGATVT